LGCWRRSCATGPGRKFANPFQVADLAHDHLDRLEHLLARLGDAPQPLAMASEDVHAQLALEFEDGLGDARLRREQRLGGLRQVQIVAHRFLDKAELMQVHIPERV
jgi:hypothetical protein